MRAKNRGAPGGCFGWRLLSGFGLGIFLLAELRLAW